MTTQIPWERSSPGPRRWVAAAVTALLTLTVLAWPAHASPPDGVDLRVLLVTNGQPSVEAIATQLDREGVPYVRVSVLDDDRVRLTPEALVDPSTGRGRYQAVVLPNQAGGGLTAEENEALGAYERAYGVRQVNAYDYPGASMGLQPPGYSGSLDGAPATVTEAGRRDAFRYLRGPLTIDDVDPQTLEVYGYVAAPSPALAEDETFTPLVTVTAGGSTGSLMGVHVRDGREQLVITAGYNPSMQWFNSLAHGIVTWMTRGLHLGHQRNYFAVHIDDVLVSDGRWDVTNNCTPGDDCVDPAVTTPDIRMTPEDVTRLLAWQDSRDFKLDMVFNGAGEALHTPSPGARDPLTDAFVAAQAQFPWINHTWSHPYLGCIQIAPVVQGQSWRCATTPDEQPRQDTTIPQQLGDGTYWASQSFLEAQLRDNIAFARAKGFTDFDPAELVTGEHSGLQVLPQQPVDNPFLGPALDAVGVRWTASDASREPAPRAVGAASTVPRHPMNIYYNTATYRELIDEYNWYYNSAADGGGGICENDPLSTCIAPLPAADAEQARASFDGYLRPLEVRNALSKVITNDPRPFYAHQSNLAEDGLLYPVLDGVLQHYASVYDRAVAPLVRLDLTGQGQAQRRMAAWKQAQPSATAYVDGSGVVHVSGPGSIPLTVPAGTVVDGATLEQYGGELSGWVTAPVVARPPTPGGGDAGQPVTTPSAPLIGAVSAGDARATVTWAPPADDGGAAVSGYTVRAFAAGVAEPVQVLTVAAEPTSLTVTGLTNGTSYTFDVAATNPAGTGTPSARSAAVTPMAPVTGATIGAAFPGNTAAVVTWEAPTGTGGASVTGYRVRAFLDGASKVQQTVTVPPTARSVTVTGLTNGRAYAFDVAALLTTGTSPTSARSGAVTPSTAATAPTAAVIGTPTAGDSSAAVAWSAPAATDGGAVTSYLVRAYKGTATSPERSVQVPATERSATVTGLTNGTSYTLDVLAVVDAGASPPSARSTAVTPATLPGAPTIGTASSGTPGGAITASVKWSPPASSGGSPLTGYLVTAHRTGPDGTSVDQTVVSALQPANSRSMTMTFEATGSYRFTVQAVTAVGTGASSAFSNQVLAR
jgi:hypothetical protein